jgi:hypothetical protein
MIQQIAPDAPIGQLCLSIYLHHNLFALPWGPITSDDAVARETFAPRLNQTGSDNRTTALLPIVPCVKPVCNLS